MNLRWVWACAMQLKYWRVCPGGLYISYALSVRNAAVFSVSWFELVNGKGRYHQPAFQVFTHHCPTVSEEKQPTFSEGAGVQEINQDHCSHNKLALTSRLWQLDFILSSSWLVLESNNNPILKCVWGQKTSCEKSPQLRCSALKREK